MNEINENMAELSVDDVYGILGSKIHKNLGTD